MEVSLTEYSVILRDIFNSKSHENLSCKILITTSIVYLHNSKCWRKMQDSLQALKSEDGR